jgi:uncharacterized protein YndB with AHSA1/START domain
MTHIDGEITIAAPVERVFDTVADERNEPRYNPRIVRAEMTSEGPLGRGSSFVVEPRGMGPRAAMAMQVTHYERPRRFGSSVRSSAMAVDGTLTFAPVDGGTRLHWSWDMRLRGPMRALTPVLWAVGPRWERRNWVGLKHYLESGQR